MLQDVCPVEHEVLSTMDDDKWLNGSALHLSGGYISEAMSFACSRCQQHILLVFGEHTYRYVQDFVAGLAQRCNVAIHRLVQQYV
jgi:hypothetical protein